MKFSLVWVDVSQALADKRQPVESFERPKAGGDRESVYGTSKIARVGEFWVPGALNADDVQWGITNQGEIVRVPIFAYTTGQAAKSVLMACGVELGFRARDALAVQTHKTPAAVTLFVGTTCDLLPDKTYRYYLGMSIRVNDE